jgi:hypothetical protein
MLCKIVIKDLNMEWNTEYEGKEIAYPFEGSEFTPVL